jgi:hypothetical protein
MEFDEDETPDPVDYCRDCGSRKSLRFPRMNPFGGKNDYGLQIHGIIIELPVCVHCRSDDFFLTDTPGMPIVHSLRERFRNGELSHDEFTYLEEESLTRLLQIEFDYITIPKGVEAETLAYLALLESDSSLAIKSAFSGLPNLKETAFIPTSHVFRNWNPRTGEVTFKVDLFEIILMFRHEVPRPLTAMWRRYLDLWSRRHGVNVRSPFSTDIHSL